MTLRSIFLIVASSLSLCDISSCRSVASAALAPCTISKVRHSEDPLFRRSYGRDRVRFRVSRVRVTFRVTVSRSGASRVMVIGVRFRARVTGPSDRSRFGVSVIMTLVSIVLFCVETLPVFAMTHCITDEAPNFADPFFVIETTCTAWFTPAPPGSRSKYSSRSPAVRPSWTSARTSGTSDHLHRLVHPRNTRQGRRLSFQVELLQGREELHRRRRHSAVLRHAYQRAFDDELRRRQVQRVLGLSSCHQTPALSANDLFEYTVHQRTFVARM